MEREIGSMRYILKPHEGIGDIALYDNYDHILNILDNNKIKYRLDIQDNSACTVSFNWRIIVVEDCLHLYFSEGNYKLFKISVENNKDIILPNSIHVGMKTDDALKIDQSLKFNDWDEIYESGNDYYLEDSLITGNIESLNIYIKELDDDDFDYCRW